MITFDSVAFNYPGETSKLLEGVSFTINDGEQVAVMGRNGCGKTTLGMLLIGLLSPSEGTISVTANGNAGKKPVVGFLFQDPDNGLVATTVEREVAFALENQNLSPDIMRPRVAETLQSFHLESLATRLVWELSGGEKQRLSLAGLIAASPDVLFLDEPASFLDYRGNVTLTETLDKIVAENPKMIILRITQFSTIADLYPRMLLMGNNGIIVDDKPAKVFTNPDIMEQAKVSSPYKYIDEPHGLIDGSRFLSRKLPGDPLVTLSGVSFAYDNETDDVFSDVSFSLRAGEVTALVGPSGAGKSTLAQLLCGIYSPSAGTVEKATDSTILSMCFQQPERQFFLDTIYDEVAYGIRFRNGCDTSIKDEVRTSLENAGLDYDRFSSRDPHSLSGGESRRLAFAILLALNTDIVVFDEPTCGLDDEGITSFLEMVEKLRGAGKAVVIVTHNSDIIYKSADKVISIVGGRVTFDGPETEFFLQKQYEGLLEVPQAIMYGNEGLWLDDSNT